MCSDAYRVHLKVWKWLFQVTHCIKHHLRFIQFDQWQTTFSTLWEMQGIVKVYCLLSLWTSCYTGLWVVCFAFVNKQKGCECFQTTGKTRSRLLPRKDGKGWSTSGCQLQLNALFDKWLLWFIIILFWFINNNNNYDNNNLLIFY